MVCLCLYIHHQISLLVFLGNPGQPGLPAIKKKGPPSRGFVFTFHSQSDVAPSCPGNTKLMWQGFSLLHFMGNGRARGQDLG